MAQGGGPNSGALAGTQASVVELIKSLGPAE